MNELRDELRDKFERINRRFDERDKSFDKLEMMILGLYVVLTCGLLASLIV